MKKKKTLQTFQKMENQQRQLLHLEAVAPCSEAHSERVCMRHGCALCSLLGGIAVQRVCLWLGELGWCWLGYGCVSSPCAYLLVFTGSLHFLLSVLSFAEIWEMAVTQPMLPFPGERIALSNRQAVPSCSLTSGGQYDCQSAFTL